MTQELRKRAEALAGEHRGDCAYVHPFNINGCVCGQAQRVEAILKLLGDIERCKAAHIGALELEQSWQREAFTQEKPPRPR